MVNCGEFVVIVWLGSDRMLGDYRMKELAAIALGSNLESRFGDREANLREAVRRVGELGEVRAVSSFYDTEPVGYLEQPRFLNGAMLLETELEPMELMRELLAVERAMGREREGAVAKGPRVIDLDLLLYGDGGDGDGGADAAASGDAGAAVCAGAAGGDCAGDGASGAGGDGAGDAGAGCCRPRIARIRLVWGSGTEIFAGPKESQFSRCGYAFTPAFGRVVMGDGRIEVR